MPKVYNWQLGRDMEYPYEAAYPDQQFAFVFNINRCIGCQSCTMACKSTWTFSKGQEHMWWNNVETKPYGGYPHHWDVKTLDLLGESQSRRPDLGRHAEGSESALRRVQGQDHLRGGEDQHQPRRRALGYLPTDEEWAAPNIYEDNPTGRQSQRQKGTFERAAK